MERVPKSAARGKNPRAATDSAESARLARRERRRNRSRQEILDATREVLLRDGIGALTLDAVARQVGVSKTALYYYFPSKDALLFELLYTVIETTSKTIHEAVAETKDGAAALGAIIRETVKLFAPRLDDFRLAFLHGQVARAGTVHFARQQIERIRPLNDLAFAGTAGKVAEQRRGKPSRARVEPRLLAFLAYLSALGVLTMKGMVESVGDPLLYSDEQLIEGLARVFAAAAQ